MRNNLRMTSGRKSREVIIFILVLLNFGISAQPTDSLKSDRFSIHFQTTVINQFKPGFSVKYSGENSLNPQKEDKTSVSATLYAGARLWKGASMFVDPEISGGSGLSQVKGIAAAPNGETFRVGSTAPVIYLARLYFRQVFSLTRESGYQSSDFDQLGGRVPDKYFAFTIGQIAITDFFDDNEFSHDPRTQFMSWALMDNGAWDYPASARGYTPSIVLEYVTPEHEIRYGISLVPKVANGNDMNWRVSEANSQTLEYTHRHKIKNREGAVRLLGFFTIADMGNYEQSIELSPQNPNIEDTRKNGRTKYGFGISADQDITEDMGCFLRASWNDGNNETWAFTEIDHGISAGFSMTGKRWKRENDNSGIAYVASGISNPHRQYLKAGGLGFMLGDGNLNYSWEHLIEFYYSVELVREHIYLSGAYQFLLNPAYNRDRRGPVNIFSVRVHAKI